MATTSGINGTGAGAATTGSNAFAALTSEDFVKIMFSELSRQDPLNPSDTNALLEQMSSLRSIQSSIDLSSKLEAVVTQGQFATAGGLLGKRVSGLSENFDRVEGIVRSVARTSDGPVLILQSGERVPFSSIDELVDPAPTTPSTIGG